MVVPKKTCNRRYILHCEPPVPPVPPVPFSNLSTPYLSLFEAGLVIWALCGPSTNQGLVGLPVILIGCGQDHSCLVEKGGQRCEGIFRSKFLEGATTSNCPNAHK